MTLSNIFVFAVLIVLASSCPILEFVKALSGAYAPENASILENNTNQSINKTEQQWNNISNAQAEKGCLKQAKKVATNEGYSEALVFSCKCVSQETSATKTYDCSVSAMDGSHDVSINCVKAQNKCIVISEQGTKVYNFDELEKFANG